jgi:hypothetical protein
MQRRFFRQTVQETRFNMKKLTLTIALSLGLAVVSAFAYDRDHNEYENRGGYAAERSDRLGWQINHLNRMFSHVREQLSRSGGGWRLRSEVDRISGDVDRLNWRYRHDQGSYRLQREVERLHDQLHQVEVRLRLRSGDWYRWER